MSKKFDKVLDELFTRFLLNAPQQHKSTTFRVCFELEQAYWFYLDVCREENPQLPHYKFVEFMKMMYDKFPNKSLPRPNEPDASKIHKWYQNELRKVPTYGVIMLDCSLNNVLLVEAHKSGRWSFPKGKINQNEEHIDCAIREVKEECGINITPYLDPNKFFVNHRDSYVKSKLFFAFNVPHCDFSASYNMEVRSYKWWSIKELFEIYKNNNNYKFELVYPFLHDIKQYSDNRKKIRKNKGKSILALIDKSSISKTKQTNGRNSRKNSLTPKNVQQLNQENTNLACSLTSPLNLKSEVQENQDVNNLSTESFPSIRKKALFGSLDLNKFIPRSLNFNTEFGNIVVTLNED